MYKIETVVKLLDEIKLCLENREFVEKHRLIKTAFTRTRILSFERIIKFIINMPKEGLPYEINKFLEQNIGSSLFVSKQAISKARQLISENAIYELFKMTVYTEIENPNTFKGHRVYAIDGSDLQIPDSIENRNHFGVQKSNGTPVPMAKISCCYDVLNDVVHNVVIGEYKKSERQQARELLKIPFQNDVEQPILLFDRGYPSRSFMKYLDTQNHLFLMRFSTGFLKIAVDCALGDNKIEYVFEGEIVTFRVIKFKLNTGEIEMLITNIFDDSYSLDDFKNLYFLRWGIECRYRDLKSHFELEKFSGVKPICISQDIYATFFIFNIISMVKNICDNSYQSKDNNKCTYQTNRNNLKKYFLDKLTKLISSSIDSIFEVLSIMVNKCKKNRSQIRPNRTRERKKIHPLVKYTNNYR